MSELLTALAGIALCSGFLALLMWGVVSILFPGRKR